jgi:hypothetical protein
MSSYIIFINIQYYAIQGRVNAVEEATYATGPAPSSGPRIRL